MALDPSALDDIFRREAASAGVAGRASPASFEEDPDNPRFESMPEDFAALVENIRAHGILQPIVVRRLENGRLRIRFGARRYRAAVQLGLAEIPFVVTEDPRQLDDYAQVAENERRTALQPLELATFIAKKLAKGESKATVAKKLGIHPSSVTHLLCLTDDAPPFLLELYHSRICRSPQYLYKLSNLWKVNARLVENACSGAGEVGLQLIEAIEVSLNKPQAMAADVKAVDTRHVESTSRSAAPMMPSAGSRQLELSMLDEEPMQRAEPSTKNRKALPRVFGTLDSKEVELLIFVRPSRDGKVKVRFADLNNESEVDAKGIILTRITHDPEGAANGV